MFRLTSVAQRPRKWNFQSRRWAVSPLLEHWNYGSDTQFSYRHLPAICFALWWYNIGLHRVWTLGVHYIPNYVLFIYLFGTKFYNCYRPAGSYAKYMHNSLLCVITCTAYILVEPTQRNVQWCVPLSTSIDRVHWAQCTHWHVTRCLSLIWGMLSITQFSGRDSVTALCRSFTTYSDTSANEDNSFRNHIH